MREKIMTAEDFIKLLEPINFRLWSKSSSPTAGKRNVYQLVGGWSSPSGRELRRLFQTIGGDPMMCGAGNDFHFQQTYCKDRILAALELIKANEEADCAQLTAHFAVVMSAFGIERVKPEEV